MHLCVFREKGDSCVRKSEQFIEFRRIIGGFPNILSVMALGGSLQTILLVATRLMIAIILVRYLEW